MCVSWHAHIRSKDNLACWSPSSILFEIGSVHHGICQASWPKSLEAQVRCPKSLVAQVNWPKSTFCLCSHLTIGALTEIIDRGSCTWLYFGSGNLNSGPSPQSLVFPIFLKKEFNFVTLNYIL